MIWLAWRQHRSTWLVALAGLAASITALAITGPRAAHIFDVSGLADCAAGRDPRTGTLTCGDLERQFLGGYPHVRLVGELLVALPVLIGAFWGAPLVARELEAGTHRLVWLQGITPRRWLATKLGVFTLAATALSAVLGLAFTWWSQPGDRLDGRLSPGIFAQRGIVPIGYTLLALVLGVALGSVLRRTLPAMAAVLLAVVAVRHAASTWVRPRLVDPVVVRYPTFTFFGDDPAALQEAERGWILSTRTIDGEGRVVSAGGMIRDDAAARLCGLPDRNPTKEQLDQCGDELGLRNVVEVVPADQFWALQAWETAIFVGLAVAVTAFCFWWLRARLR